MSQDAKLPASSRSKPLTWRQRRAAHGVDDEDVFRGDHRKGLYFDEQAPGGPFLEVVILEIEWNKSFCLVDGEGAFG